ncbi:MAG: hypothetical protein QG657_5789 [Acidobacteriota bacterium]|nr:hypothetical protein [Acidobacteriota bacterium]
MKTKPKDTPVKDFEEALLNPNPETSTLYYQDKETGEWKVTNPAGSMVYNYLTRDDIDLD